MDKQSLMIFNSVMIVITCLVLVFSWFYMKEQFIWGIILVVLLLLFTGYTNVMRKFPWQGMSASDTAIVVIAIFILGFAWFYLREQVCWAAILVLFMLIFIEYLKLKKWLKDTVSIQVVIHKNEKDEDRKG